VFEKTGSSAPQTRVDPVRRDGGVCTDLVTAARDQHHACVVLLHPLDPHPKSQHARRERIDEHAVQVGTKEVELRRTKMALGGLAELRVQEERSVVPAHEIDCVGPDADRPERWKQTQVGEQAHGVRAELERRSDRLDRRRLLEHLDLDALADERECRRDASDATTDDRDLHPRWSTRERC
jgi:hypothetical protein